MYGNFGKFLKIDLNDKTFSEFNVPQEYYEKYLGGKGLGARLLWDFLPSTHKIDPLSEDNVLLFLTGPLVGLNVMGSARYVVMTKSPLSKFITEAYGGGFFPYALKATGYDGLIITGKSDAPVFLEIINNEIKLKDASDYWGKGVFAVHDDLVSKYPHKIRTAIIGQAGENLVRYAAIINDRDRAAARGGPGAVMGSKLLKAIVVAGSSKPKIKNEVLFNEINKKYRNGLVHDVKIRDKFGLYGTSGGIPTLNKMGILPTKNFSEGQFADFSSISGQYMKESGLLVGRDTCSSCVTFCKRKIEGEYNGNKLEKDGSSLEYETLAAFGSMILNHDIKFSGWANQLCNDYGLDTISTGGSIAFAMEASEKGLLQKINYDLKWGKKDAEHAIHKIALKEGIGSFLGEGVMRMSEIIGGSEFSMHVKGMEIAYHEPRGKVGLGLSYAVSPRGGSHMEGYHDTITMMDNANPKLGAVKGLDRFNIEGKSDLVFNFENVRSFTNSLIICAFDVVSIGKNQNLDYLCELTSAATGYEINFDRMLEIGSNVYNMLRAVAVREGCIGDDDNLPDRFKYEALHFDNGIESKISENDLNIMLSEYYELRNWSPDGTISPEILSSLL